MGVQCSCFPEPTPAEIVMTKVVKNQPRTTVEVQNSSDDNFEIVLEFKTFSYLELSLDIEPPKENLEDFEIDLDKLEPNLLLQSICKGFLLRKKFLDYTESHLFGVYPILSGSIDEKSSKYIKGIEESLTLSATPGFYEILEKELLVQLKDDTFYQGEWNTIKKKKEGFGALVESDGSKYIGQFKNNLKSGQGLQIWKNGNFYEGEFAKGKMHGKGKLTFEEGKVLTGNFKDGELEGHGKETWPNSSYYVGNFVETKKSGKGAFCIPGFSTYKGEFVNDLFEGTGSLVFEDGKSYEGEWKEGNMHGQGEFKWPNGKVYKGCYVNGKKHGIGRLKYPDKKVYNGGWENDVQHGKAIFTYYDRNKKRMRSMNSLWEYGNKVAWLKKDGEFYGT